MVRPTILLLLLLGASAAPAKPAELPRPQGALANLDVLWPLPPVPSNCGAGTPIDQCPEPRSKEMSCLNCIKFDDDQLSAAAKAEYYRQFKLIPPKAHLVTWPEGDVTHGVHVAVSIGDSEARVRIIGGGFANAHEVDSTYIPLDCGKRNAECCVSRAIEFLIRSPRVNLYARLMQGANNNQISTGPWFEQRWKEEQAKPATPAVAAQMGQPLRSPNLPAGSIAVLEFRRRGATDVDGPYFSDLVRARVLKAAPQLRVMTRENMQVLLQASGKKLEDCEGECEVETGRNLGADYIITGDLLSVGRELRLSLKLYESKGGALRAASVAKGSTAAQLEPDTARAADELFAGN